MNVLVLIISVERYNVYSVRNHDKIEHHFYYDVGEVLQEVANYIYKIDSYDYLITLLWTILDRDPVYKINIEVCVVSKCITIPTQTYKQNKLLL